MFIWICHAFAKPTGVLIASHSYLLFNLLDAALAYAKLLLLCVCMCEWERESWKQQIYSLRKNFKIEFCMDFAQVSLIYRVLILNIKFSGEWWTYCECDCDQRGPFCDSSHGIYICLLFKSSNRVSEQKQEQHSR